MDDTSAWYAFEGTGFCPGMLDRDGLERVGNGRENGGLKRKEQAFATRLAQPLPAIGASMHALFLL